jgi:hypothetical protein
MESAAAVHFLPAVVAAVEEGVEEGVVEVLSPLVAVLAAFWRQGPCLSAEPCILL